MNAKHTPGPWFVRVGRSITAPTPVGSHCITPTITLCDVFSGGSGIEEADANAHLIAAAPEVLEALRLAVRQNEHDMLMTGEELRQCRAAIAKATGEAST